MAKKTTSANQKARYANYKSAQTWKANREASLKRHIAANPDDAIAQAALRALGSKTAPRRAGKRSERVVVDGQVVRASDRLYREIKRLVTAAGRADVYQQKNQASQVASERKKNAMKGK